MSDALRDYELVLIAAPQLDDEGLAALNERVAGRIASAGGEVAETKIWGRRRLAYAIRKQSEGTYVQFDFRIPPSSSRELERSLRMDEQIIRHLIVRTDED